MAFNTDSRKEIVEGALDLLSNKASINLGGILTPEAMLNLANILGFAGRIGRTKPQPAMIAEMRNTSAYLMVISSNIDSSSASGSTVSAMFNRFFITDIAEERSEKIQITETFGDPDIKFFGNKIKIYSFAGVLLEAWSSGSVSPFGFGLQDASGPEYKYKYLWASSLAHMYDNVMGGSKLAENKEIVVMMIGNHLIEGYPMNLSLRENANRPNLKNFAFNLVVKRDSFVDNEVKNLYGWEQFNFVKEETKTEIDALINNINKVKQQIEMLYERLADLSDEDRVETYLDSNINETTEDAYIRMIEEYLTELSKAGQELNSKIQGMINKYDG